MDNSRIKKYFDDLAPSWDEMCSPFPVDFNKLLSCVPFKEGMRILDVGTGAISNFLFSKTNSEVVAIDISSKMIDIANSKNSNKNIKFLCKDLFNFEERGFDMVVMYNCFPHFLDINGVENKTHELLNQNGCLLIAHDMGRNQLNECHKNMDKSLTRDLLDIETESKPFLKNYKLIYKEDSTNGFIMLFQKI
jgi:ubiquinone/menaquinone biosynthesis C-methylase UbiE